nr:immunoglobulin heavy chain junction region [Homo sapiens]
RHGCVLLCER